MYFWLWFGFLLCSDSQSFVVKAKCLYTLLMCIPNLIVSKQMLKIFEVFIEIWPYIFVCIKILYDKLFIRSFGARDEAKNDGSPQLMWISFNSVVTLTFSLTYYYLFNSVWLRSEFIHRRTLYVSVALCM